MTAALSQKSQHSCTMMAMPAAMKAAMTAASTHDRGFAC